MDTALQGCIFLNLKKQRTLTLVLVLPIFCAKFVLDTDASADRLGAVLSQVVSGSVIAYASKMLIGAERWYGIVQHKEKCWLLCGHHAISDRIFMEGNLFYKLTIVHCSGFIVSKSLKARCFEGMVECK